ncbi:MAG: hypothetical protein JWN04_5151 [Myxococcaceae bacterium]|nr:hypothetical protein [Myxococcaceae bacterium]
MFRFLLDREQLSCFEPRRRDALRLVVQTVASVILALVAVRLLHATRLGLAILDAIPSSFWRSYHQAIGLDTAAGVESISDADLIPLLVGCLLVVSVFVALVTRALRRFGRLTGA